jgi:hypothetical protein
MELPVTIDPADPGKFEIRWEEVPGMADRAAANDPTLADPAGAKRKAQQALLESGAAGPAGPYAPSADVRATVVKAQAEAAKQGDEMPDHWQESLDQAASEPAPAGKTRAVVLFAASEATLKTEGGQPDGSGGHQFRTRHGKHDVVLAVNVPGSEPYAVYKPKFKHKGGKGIAMGAGIPALVSSSDPSDVEILWDELPSVREQAQETMAEATGVMQDRMAAATQQMDQAMQQVNPPPAQANAPQPPGGAPGVTPEMKAMMIQNAKMALSTVPPNMREMLIQQYRMAGIEIDDEGNVVE